MQNVPPGLLFRFLREHRSEWADYNVDAFTAASLKNGSCSFPGLRPIKFSGNQVIMPLAHTVEDEEVFSHLILLMFFFSIMSRSILAQRCDLENPGGKIAKF